MFRQGKPAEGLRYPTARGDDGLKHRLVGGQLGVWTGHQVRPAHGGAGRRDEIGAVNGQTGRGRCVSENEGSRAGGAAAGALTGDAGHAQIDLAGGYRLGVGGRDAKAGGDGEGDEHGRPPMDWLVMGLGEGAIIAGENRVIESAWGGCRPCSRRDN